MMKRKGQHDVHAIVRVYSPEGEVAIAKWIGAKPRILADEEPTWRLVHLHWTPPPTKNEWNTQHDFRKMLARMMGDLWYDIVLADYKWKPVATPSPEKWDEQL